MLRFVFAVFFCNKPIISVATRAAKALGLQHIGLIESVLVLVPLAVFWVCRIKQGKAVRVKEMSICLGAIAALILATSLLHPEYDAVLFSAKFHYNVFDTVINPSCACYAVLLIFSCDDEETLLDCFRVAAWAVLAYGVVRLSASFARGGWTYIAVEGIEKTRPWSVEFGFDMLFSSLLLLFFYLSDKRRLDMFGAVLSAGMLLSSGGRAAFVYLVVGVFVLACLFKMASRRVLLGLFALVLIAFLVREPLAGLLDYLSSATGIYFRTLRRLLSGSFGDLTGRERIYSAAADLISKKPLFGYGFYGDRYHLTSQFYWGFPHNIFLEVLLTFGFVAGAPLIGFFVWLLYRCISSQASDRLKYLFIVLFFISCQLLLSQSLWYCYPFWALVGLMLRMVADNKERLFSRKPQICALGDD